MVRNKNKREFSKTLLVQESVLIWIITLSFIILAFYAVSLGYTGSLPWLAAMASFPWAAYGVSQVWYYKKSMIENSKDGIKYETVIRDLDEAYKKYWDNKQSYSCEVPQVTASTTTSKNEIDPFGPV